MTNFYSAAQDRGLVPIATADYPTPAQRPRNSRLDGSRLMRDYGVALPDWRDSLKVVVGRLLGA